MCECLIWRWVEMKQRWKEKSWGLQMLGCSILFHSRAGWQMCCEIPRFTDHYSFRATLLLQSRGPGRGGAGTIITSILFLGLQSQTVQFAKRKRLTQFYLQGWKPAKDQQIDTWPPTCPILSGSKLGKITLTVLIKTGHHHCTKYPLRFWTEAQANIMKYVNQVVITSKLNWRSEATLHCVILLDIAAPLVIISVRNIIISKLQQKIKHE